MEGEREKIIKCHQFDTTWGSDAIFVLDLLFAAGWVDVFGLSTGILILTLPPGRLFLKKRRIPPFFKKQKQNKNTSFYI